MNKISLLELVRKDEDCSQTLENKCSVLLTFASPVSNHIESNPDGDR